jgi:hypothetical protein
MKTFLKFLPFILLAFIQLTSCSSRLDIKPTQEFSADSAYKDIIGYKEGLAKVYGSMAMTGNQAPTNQPDIKDFNEGYSDYLRLVWQTQELSTDEAVIGWLDGAGNSIQHFHTMNWNANNEFITGTYNRLMIHITFCNEFYRQTDPAIVASRVKSETERAEIAFFRAEARFLRALSYWLALDLFGNPPFMDFSFSPGGTPPPQIKQADLYDHIEKELLEVQNQLKEPRTNEYGRADKAAAWMLLARLYLNSATYKPSAPNYTGALTYSKKVIDAGYSLEPEYKDLFLADNDTRRNEVILSLNYDGIRTRNWGGTTFLVNASTGLEIANYKITYGVPNGGWRGIRTTEQLVDLFPTGNVDKRFLFEGTKKFVDTISDKFSNGLAGGKFRNVTKAGVKGKDPGGQHCDIDFPLFRLAEAYLIYAEASLRGADGGDLGQSLNYVNLLRSRAYGSTDGNVSGIDLNFLLDERARELHWEGFRRTDLIRHGKFTSVDYLWAWKGGSRNGTAVPDFRKLYPIPASDLGSNPGLKQNVGY